MCRSFHQASGANFVAAPMHGMITGGRHKIVTCPTEGLRTGGNGGILYAPTIYVAVTTIYVTLDMSRLKLSLLGAFGVELDGSPVSDFGTDKTRALLAYLCVEASRAHRRDALAGLLWPEQPEEVARHNLRQTL